MTGGTAYDMKLAKSLSYSESTKHSDNYNNENVGERQDPV